jgi:CheY-like chemotaxis protein
MPREDTQIPLHPGPLVLVVDDNLRDRVEVTRMVRGLGYPVRACRVGSDALHFIRTNRPHVRALVAELGMDGMDGGELAERARDLDPSLCVVLLAAPDDPRAAELLAGYRDFPILLKPIRHADLYGILATLVGLPARTPIPASVSARGDRIRRRTPDRI